MSRKEYQSITLYKDMAPQVLELTREEAGDIYQAIFRFACYDQDTDFSHCDRFVRSLWETTKLKLQAGKEKDEHISKTNSENAKKRWNKEKTDATAYDHMQTDATAYDRTTITDTVTETISSTSTNSFTVTKTETEMACADSDKLHASAAAECAEPAADLFTLKQIMKKVKQNNVQLTEEGVQEFYEQMQDDGWTLYGKPVERRTILRVLREFANKHPEYAPEPEEPALEKTKKNVSNGVDVMEASIYAIASNYISGQLFSENYGGHHCLIRDYCPREAFTEKQLKYILDEWGIWMKPATHIRKKDSYLEREVE